MIQSPSPKLDCITRVITPENIEFEYALAGPFQRLPAFAFDFAVRILSFLALVFIFALLTSWTPFGFAIASVISSLLFFAMSWFYGIFFEATYNGRTPGKMLFRLRAISVDGRPINATQAALRNLLRLADMNVLLSLQMFGSELPPAYVIPTMFVGMIVMTATSRMQRIGDLAAGTMVVSEHLRRSPWNMQPEDLRSFGLADLIPATFRISSSLAQATGLYMENRKRLSPMRRQEVAKHLAEPLIRRFDMLPDTSPDLLMCALYVRTYLSEEQRQEGMDRLRSMTPMKPPRAPVARKSPSESAAQAQSDVPPEATPEGPSDVPSEVPHDQPSSTDEDS